MEELLSNYDLGYIVGILVGCIAIALIPTIFFLLTLQNTLKAIQPGNRYMPPANVWLMLIPIFNIIWMFIVVARVSDSIRAELAARGTPASDRPTYSVGLTYCILFLVGGIIPFFGGLLSLAGIICWIIYWIKVNEFRKRFLEEPFNANPDSEIFGYV